MRWRVFVNYKRKCYCVYFIKKFGSKQALLPKMLSKWTLALSFVPPIQEKNCESHFPRS